MFGAFSSVKLIVYLRRQDSYLPSFYSSVVNNGACPSPFETFCSQVNLDYLANLDAWAGFLGRENIIARPFARKYWAGDDITGDFLAQLGCDICPDKLAASEPKNRALSAEVIEVLLAAGGGQSIPRFPAFRRFLSDQFAGIEATPSKRLMTQSILENLRQRYDAGNRELGERYFSRTEVNALGFSQHDQVEADPRPALAATDYARLLRALWEEQVREQAVAGDQRQRLTERIARRGELIAQRDEVIARRDEVIARRDEVIAQRDEVIARRNEAIARRDEAIRLHQLRTERLSHELARRKRFPFGRRVNAMSRRQLSLLDVLVSEDFAAMNCEKEQHSGHRRFCARQPLPDVASGNTELLAQCLVSRYAEDLTPYRRERIYAQLGLKRSRPMLAEWVGHCGVALLPLLAQLKARLLEQSVLQGRSAPIPVYAPGRGLHLASLWTYATMRSAPVQAVVYDFQDYGDDKTQHAFLADWPGQLVCDENRLTGPKAHGQGDELCTDNRWIESLQGAWALDRKNWLFAASRRSGERAANVMSLIQTARVNGLEPQSYLRDVLERLSIAKPCDLDALLPLQFSDPPGK